MSMFRLGAELCLTNRWNERPARLPGVIVLAICLLTMTMIVPVNPACAQQSTPAQEGGRDVANQAGEASPPTGEVAVPAPPSAAPVRQSFESPRKTMFTFLEAIGRYSSSKKADSADLDHALECLDLSEVSEERGEEIVFELWGVLNRWGLVRQSHLPSKATIDVRDLRRFSFYPRDLKASSGFIGKDSPYEKDGDFAYFPAFERAYPGGSIELVRLESGEWRFSAETVAAISDFYRGVVDLPIREGEDERKLNFALYLRSQMPAVLRSNTVFTLEYWQWIGIFVLILAGVLLDFTVRFFVAAMSRRIIARQGGTASNETLRRLVRPLGLISAGCLWLWTVRMLNLPDDAFRILLVAVRFIMMIAGVWAAFRLTDLGGEVLASKAAKTATRFDDLLVPLVRKTLKVFISVFGLIYIADSLDIEILPLLTGLGIGGAAIAFASKDTVENFFGSIAVIVDRPFEVGDWIVIGDIEGTVELVGFRSTRIRTFYNSLITLPNSNLVRATVDNYGKRKYRRFRTHISVTYDTPPDKIEAFCEGIRELVRTHPYTRKDYYQVWLHQFSPSSLDILLYIFHETPDWSTELRERHRLMGDIIRLANQLGVEFAFPTQTLHMIQENATDGSLPSESRVTAIASSATDGAARHRGRLEAHKLTADAPWRKEKPGAYEFTQAARSEPEHDEDSQIESRIGGAG